MGEVNLYKQIIDFVNRTGCWAYRNSVGGKTKYRFGVKGQADISGIILNPTGKLHGRRLEIEVKTPDGDLSQKQKDFLYNVSCRGGVTMVVTSLEEVIEKFKELGLCRV